MAKSTVLLSAGAVTAIAGVVVTYLWPFSENGTVLRLPGVVEVQDVRLGSKIGGRVAEVFVAEGDVVSGGEAIFRLAVPELEAQAAQLEARLAAAKAAHAKAVNGARPEEVAAAAARLAAAEAKLERLRKGWRAEEKEQALNDWNAAKADLLLAEREFRRIEELHKNRSISRAEYDAALGARDRALARASAAEAYHRMLTSGSRPEDVAAAAAERDVAKAQLDLLRAGTRAEDIAAAAAQVREIEGKLAELNANLAEAVVRAPGKVSVEVLGVRPGDLVAPNQPVVRVLRADDLWVKVYVPATELGKVRLGQKVAVTIDSHPGREFGGEVFYIADVSEFTPRNVQSVDEREHQVFAVKVRVPDTEGIFKSGMAAEVILRFDRNGGPVEPAAGDKRVR